MIRTDEPFHALARALTEARSPVGVAELHGGLCGALCVGGPRAGIAWLDRCMRDCDSAHAAAEALSDRFATLGRESWRALTGTQMEFAPLLPADDEPLADRVQALASWCNGFVSGLGVAGFTLGESRHDRNEEVLEIVRDIVEIGRAGINAEAETDGESAESSLAQINEFVRVGVQILFEELGRKAYASGATTVH